jgi:hypothetical protein
MSPRNLTSTELTRLIELTSALAEMRPLLPVELFIKMDTFHADLLAEQEDRTAYAQKANARATRNSSSSPLRDPSYG